MKKVAESCPGTTTNLQAGNTSQTGTNVLDRTLKNTPANEATIRGVHRENLDFLRCMFGEQFDELIQTGRLAVI